LYAKELDWKSIEERKNANHSKEGAKKGNKDKRLGGGGGQVTYFQIELLKSATNSDRIYSCTECNSLSIRFCSLSEHFLANLHNISLPHSPFSQQHFPLTNS
jgi:hypothetical protein